jgi:hypothetical protein
MLSSLSDDDDEDVSVVARLGDGIDSQLSVASAGPPLKADEVLNLVVGGRRFSATVATLTRAPHSFFTGLLSGRFLLQRNADGAVCIDRDGDLFAYVLAFLESPDDALPPLPSGHDVETLALLERLVAEFAYYCIDLPLTSRETLFALGPNNDGLFDFQALDARRGDGWQPLPQLPRERTEFGAAAVNGFVYVVGGFGDDVLRELWRFDIVARKWHPMPPMREPRFGHGVVAAGGKIFAIGGYGTLGYLSSVEAFDPETNRWRYVRSLLSARYGTAVCYADGAIYAIGGENADGDGIIGCERYDLESDRWSVAPEPTEKRCTAAAAFLDGRLYVAGGVVGENNRRCSVRSVEYFDFAKSVWLPAGPLCELRFCPVAVAFDGCVTVLAGQHKKPASDEPGAPLVTNPNTIETYDVDADAWHCVRGPRRVRSSPYAVCVAASPPCSALEGVLNARREELATATAAAVPLKNGDDVDDAVDGDDVDDATDAGDDNRSIEDVSFSFERMTADDGSWPSASK